MEANTVFADAFSKIDLEEIKLVENELPNGLTHSIINTIEITPHAKKRGKERFGHKDGTETDIEVRKALREAKYIGLITDSSKKESYMYVYKGMGIYLSLDYKAVRTLIPHGEHYLRDILSYEELKEAIIQLQAKELNKLARRRNRLKKKTTNDKFDYGVEIAELERKIFKTKSEKAKQRYIERKEQLIKEMQENEETLSHMEQKIRKLSGSLAFVMNK